MYPRIVDVVSYRLKYDEISVSEIFYDKKNVYSDPEEAAVAVREQWCLSDWPIESVTDILEKKGVYVVFIDTRSSFDGLCGFTNKKRPIIIINDNTSVDRKRLSISHELGHFFTLKTEDKKRDEINAFRFGAAFLMPKQVLLSTLGKKRKSLDYRELFILKQQYGISLQALIRRCLDLDIINEYVYRNLMIEFRTKGFHKAEPVECKNVEVPTLVKSRLLRVINEGIVSEGEIMSKYPYLIELLQSTKGPTAWEWNNLLFESDAEKNKVIEAAADSVIEEYSEGGSLSGFEAMDDIIE